MRISVHCFPSWRDAFCFTGPWINHIFHSSTLSSIMQVFFWVHPSMLILVTDWMNRWDCGCTYFSLLRDTGTPIFSGATSISPSHPYFSSLCSYPIQRLLFISPPVKSRQPASQPTKEAGCYRGCTALLLLVHGKRHSKPQALSSILWLVVTSFFATVRLLLQLTLKLPPISTPNSMPRR